MSFYHFSQNNSGGSFTGPARHVIMEADNANEANDLAEEYGLYFDGCHTGDDCSCCGDRWYPVDEYDAQDEPMIYGEKPEDYNDIFKSESIPSYVIVSKNVKTLENDEVARSAFLEGK